MPSSLVATREGSGPRLTGGVAMDVKVGLLLTLAVVGCTSQKNSASASSTTRQAAAVAQSGPTGLIVAFSAPENASRLDEVLSPEPPKDFHWVMIRTDPAAASAAASPGGLAISLHESSPVIAFSQAYQDACNPPQRNFDPCWFIESYTSGDPGLSGTLKLQYDGTNASVSYDLTWEGETDRFGSPPTYYKHGSTGGYSGKVINGGSQ